MKRIESENKDWGFYGTFKNRPEEPSGDVTANAFDRMARVIVETWKLSAKQAQKFLDSRMGRHLADSLSYFKGTDRRTFERVLLKGFGSGRRYREFYNW